VFTLKDFPVHFREARKNKHMTQDTAADIIHRTKRQVQNIENRGQIPGADAFVRGCRLIMGVDPMDYLNPDDDEEDATT